MIAIVDSGGPKSQLKKNHGYEIIILHHIRPIQTGLGYKVQAHACRLRVDWGPTVLRHPEMFDGKLYSYLYSFASKYIHASDIL